MFPLLYKVRVLDKSSGMKKAYGTVAKSKQEAAENIYGYLKGAYPDVFDDLVVLSVQYHGVQGKRGRVHVEVMEE